MQLWGVLPERSRQLLRSAYEESLSVVAGEWQQGVAGKQVFSINLWQRSRADEKVRI
jgi:hypothetical protein